MAKKFYFGENFHFWDNFQYFQILVEIWDFRQKIFASIKTYPLPLVSYRVVCDKITESPFFSIDQIEDRQTALISPINTASLWKTEHSKIWQTLVDFRHDRKIKYSRLGCGDIEASVNWLISVSSSISAILLNSIKSKSHILRPVRIKFRTSIGADFDAVFYRMDSLLYYKFGNMVIFRS